MENPYQSPQVPTNAGFTPVNRDADVFSWKRLLKGLACGLSIMWLVALNLGASEASFCISFRTRLVTIVITIAANLPILLSLRGRMVYLVGVPFFLLLVWILWG
jgi:hypothetical protein